MRKSDYPQYYGGPKRSRGPRTFRYWFHMLEQFYSTVSKKRKRWLMRSWLIADCDEFYHRGYVRTPVQEYGKIVR